MKLALVSKKNLASFLLHSKLENFLIPSDFSYSSLSGLSKESAERLSAVKPETLGQASRIFGIRPTDITIIGSKIKNIKN